MGEQAEEVKEPTEDGEVSEPQSMTIEQVEKLINQSRAETERAWQSRFDKLLKEKKETENGKKTAEEQIAELRRMVADERLSKARMATGIDSTLVESMRSFLSEDEEGIKSGASQIQEFIKAQIESGIKAGVDAEVSKRFKGSPKPTAGEPGGQLTYNDILKMSDEQLREFTPKEIAEIQDRSMR